MAGKNRRSLNIKIILSLIIGLCLIVFIGWLSANTYTRIGTQELRDHLIDKSQLFQNYLKGELDKVDIIANMLSNQPLLQQRLLDADNNDLRTRSNQFLEHANQKLKTSNIFILDKTGLTISSSDYLSKDSFIDKNYAFRPYFTDALEHGKGHFLAIGITSNELGYYVARAIYNETEQLGVLVVKLDMDLLQTLSNDFLDDFALVDEKNIIFYSSNPRFYLKSIGPISTKDRLFIARTKQYPIPDIQPLKINLNTYNLNNAVPVRIHKTNYIFNRIEMTHPKWSILVFGSIDKIRSNAYRNATMVCVICIILLISFYLLYKRRIENERLQTIVENLPSGVTLFNENLQMLICNDRFKELLQFPEEMFLNHLPDMKQLVDYNARRGEYGPGIPEEKIAETLAKAKMRDDHVFERVRPDGTILEIRGKWLKDAFVTTYTDITERKKAEEEAKRNATYLQALLQNLDQGVTVIDENLNIIFWNKAFFTLLEFPEHLIKPVMSYEDLLRFNAERGEYGPGDPEQQVKMRLQASLKFEPHHFERQRPNGRTLEVTGKPLKIDGKSVGFITTYVDITEHKRMAARLRKMANTDVLTELYNRRYFTLLLEREIKRSQRAGHALSVLLMDLDHFKSVNDNHGHTIGDRTLKKFAEACKKVLRNIDIMGRLGGEEFCVFLPETNRDGAFILAERLRAAIEELPIQNENNETFFITVSIGVAVYDSLSDERMEDIIKRADKALYRAKSMGRNKVC
ncbi:MAG: PAS-domain containing protein [Methylocystaceae bacterium]|nr:PAS-domain containing protein [Methylocystaceae bacterium]